MTIHNIKIDEGVNSIKLSGWTMVLLWLAEIGHHNDSNRFRHAFVLTSFASQHRCLVIFTSTNRMERTRSGLHPFEVLCFSSIGLS